MSVVLEGSSAGFQLVIVRADSALYAGGKIAAIRRDGPISIIARHDPGRGGRLYTGVGADADQIPARSVDRRSPLRRRGREGAIRVQTEGEAGGG
jgi:hypothetical protein